MTAGSVQNLQVLVYLFKLSFQMFNLVTPLLNYILYFNPHQTFIYSSKGIMNSVFTNQTWHSSEANIDWFSSIDRVSNRVNHSSGWISTAAVIIGDETVGVVIGFVGCVLEAGFELFFDSFFYLFHELHIFFGLLPICFFFEYFHFFYFMIGKFELAFDMIIFIFEYLSFFKYFLSFNSILFFA